MISALQKTWQAPDVRRGLWDLGQAPELKGRQVVHILGRFPVLARMGKTIDEIRVAEAKELKAKELKAKELKAKG